MLSPLAGIIAGYKRFVFFVWIYLLLMLMSDIILQTTKLLNQPSLTSLTANVFICLNFLIIARFFYKNLEGKYRAFVYAGAVVFLFMLIRISVNGWFYFDRVNAFLGAFVFVLLCVIYLFTILLSEETAPLMTSYKFWFVIGLMIYNSAVILVFGLSKYLLNSDPALYKKIWSFHDLANLTQCLIFFKVVQLYKEQQIQKMHGNLSDKSL